jgi:hypothetical protein
MEEKAVYAYPKEHYEYWQQEFPNIALPWGMFGENLTTEGLNEDMINIGDHFVVLRSKLKAYLNIVLSQLRDPLKKGRDRGAPARSL